MADEPLEPCGITPEKMQELHREGVELRKEMQERMKTMRPRTTEGWLLDLEKRVRRLEAQTTASREGEK